MKTIYKSSEGKKAILDLYDAQLARLETDHRDIYIDTSFGRTHVVETGNTDGIPLLIFHGGNATTAYTLLDCGFLMDSFHIYAADIIGHPGKSAEVNLSPYNYDYGIWAGDIITALGYDSISCFSGSFGAGVIVKAMCAVPDKIRRAVLYVPSAIANAPAPDSLRMMIPMIMYTLTHELSWFTRCMLPLALTEDNISQDTYETASLSMLYTKVKAGMPSNVPARLIGKCHAPTLVMAAEKDCMYPARSVLPRAKRIIPNCTTYLMRGRGHLCALTQKQEETIVKFLGS